MVVNENQKIFISHRAKRTSCPVFFNFFILKNGILNLSESVSQG